MICHEPDRSFRRLSSCYKRAQRYGVSGDATGHKLSIAWDNCKLLIDDKQDAFAISCLDWFAKQVDEFLEKNLLSEDQILQFILYDWKVRLFFDPIKMVKRCV